MKTPLIVGKKYFVRTVTVYYVGKLKEIKGDWLVLENASWVADTGRFNNFLKNGSCNEHESYVDDVYVPLNAIIDATQWQHELFNGSK